MEFKQIKELMAAMQRCGTTKVQIKNGTFELHLERSGQEIVRYPVENYEDEDLRPKFVGGPQKSNAPLPRTQERGLTQAEEKETPGIFITSPMVGTFYSASSPEDSDFVKVGDFVEKGTVVCIIEAMKVLNEIKAQVSGTIVEVLVENGHPVEFGTKIFRIQ